MSFLSRPLVPKNPNGPLRVIELGRVSTEHQPIENIEASHRYADKYLECNYKGPIETKRLGERASGMRTDRQSIIEAEELIATGTWDLVIAEDLSRFYRNPRHQYAFVQDAVDNGTRVICIGDNLDTADDNWEVNMGAASLRHGLYIPDTRRRVRRTATDSFHKGGMVAKIRFGYRKLSKEEAKSGKFGPVGLRIVKVSECTEVIREMRSMILSGQGYQRVAEWLNDQQIKPGPYVKRSNWTGKLVKECLSDPILHGTRIFRDIIYQPIFRTGKHKRSKNTDSPEMETYEQLAHLTSAEHEELLMEMTRRANEHSPSKAGRDHPLANRPRSKTLWPGQHMTCGICTGLFYWYADDLKCQNSFKHGAEHCWNHVQVSAEQARLKVISWILSELAKIPDVRETLIESAWREYSRTLQSFRSKELNLDAEIRELEKQSSRLAKAIRMSDDIDALVKESKMVNDDLEAARHKKRKIEQERSTVPFNFVARAEFGEGLDKAILELSRSSYEFCALMRRWIPEFVIYPVQAIDSGLVRPRARVTLRLSDAPRKLDVANTPDSEVTTTLDLFAYPAHIEYLGACLAEKARNPNMTLKEIGAKLEISHMTVKRAFDLRRQMQELGVNDPYRELRAPPEKASRWKTRRSRSLSEPETVQMLSVDEKCLGGEIAPADGKGGSQPEKETESYQEAI